MIDDRYRQHTVDGTPKFEFLPFLRLDEGQILKTHNIFIVVKFILNVQNSQRIL